MEENKEEAKTEKKSLNLKNLFKIKLTKWDIISIVILIVFMILVSIPAYLPKDNCEVARPAYKCASFKDVLTENCIYWGKYDCNTEADISLTQIEWYIQNLCELQNKYHNSDLECSNLMRVCNQIVGNQTCPFGV